ncbi:MAG: SPOR domain-containing protein [Bacteroidetes bacterium]|nr:SPOR domain-containing protein [Bacteroidota bacterium]
MNINTHIRTLLYRQDSLVIPSLGVFTTKYEPAFYDPRKKTMVPPAKIVEFTENREASDTILENFIAEQEEISLNEAAREISDYVGKIVDALKKGQRVFLNQIGILSMDKDLKIVFEPDRKQNYTPEAANSSPITIKPVKRRRSDQPESLSQMPGNKTKKIVIGAIAALAVLIIAFLLIDPFGFSLFHKPSQPVEQNQETNRQGSEEPPAQLPDEAVQPDTQPLSVDQQAQSEKTDTILESKPAPTPAPEPEIIEQTATEKPHFHVIVSSYDTRELASHYADELAAEGFNTSVVGPSKTGHFRVSIGSFTDRQEALKFLRNIRSTGKPNAWLLSE